MAFLCQTPEPTPAPPATQTVVQQADPLFRDAFNRVFNRADTVAAQPYQPFTGQRIAGLTPDTMASFNVTRQNVGAYQPFVGLAGQQAAQAGQSLPQRNVASYMNPYTQNVIDVAKRETIRSDDIARQGRNFAARQAGAFGGGRHGIVEAEAQRALGQRLDDIQTAGLSQAYDKALTAIDRESQNQTRSAAVLGDLGSRATTLGYQDATALDTIGTRQQTQEQANRDLAYKDFLAQRDWERDQVRFLSDILNRAPQSAQMSSRQTETAQFTPQASPISQAAGLATAGLGAYGLFKSLFKEGGVVSYADGGLVDLPDAELQRRYNDAATPREDKQAVLDELRRRGVGLTGRRSLATAIPGMNRANPDRARPGEEMPMPPGLAPRYEAPNVEENAPAPRPGLTDISAVPPQLTLSNADDAQPPRPQFQAPAAPSLANIRMPQAPGETDYQAELNKTLGGLQTPQQAREAVKPVEPTLVKDPNEGLPRWVMPVLRAGLSMMQAKPGQSALAGIGAGAEAGISQAMQDREEARKVEAENQRRRERAEDVTERTRDRAAQDARTVREEAFQAGRMAMDQGRMSFDRYRAALDTALAEKRLTLEQHRAALDGARLGLEARRTETAERQSDAYMRLTERQAAVQGRVPLVNDKGQTIFWDVATQGKPPEGFVPAGVASTGLRSDSSERTRMYTEAATLIKNDPNNIGKSPEELARLVERYVQTRLGGGGGGTMNAADREAVRRALLGTQ